MNDTAPFLQRLRERKLFQWTAAYLAGAWVALQVLDLLGDRFAWPDAIFRVAAVLLGVGFLAALVFAWYHGEMGEQKVTPVEVGLLAGILVIAAAVVAFVSGGTHIGTAPSGAEAAMPTATVPARGGSVAVLPFEDLSPGRDQEHFAEGMSEEIRNTLAQASALRVAARTSSLSFKGKDMPLSEVARQLQVAHVVEGSVRKAGEQLRITAQLVDARTGYQVWSQRFDRDLEDVFAVQEEIARAVGEALQVRLTEEIARGSRRAANTGAYELYLRGRLALNPGTLEPARRAVGFFQGAIDADPAYAPAYVGLAEAYLHTANDEVPRTVYPAARAAVLKALELDSTLAEAHAAQGIILVLHDFDYAAGERAIRRSLALNPNQPVAHGYLALARLVRGDPEGALAAAGRAFALDPLSPHVSWMLEWTYVFTRRWDDALAQHRMTEALAPDLFDYESPAAVAYRAQGRYDLALGIYRQVEESAREEPIHGLAVTYARMGRTAEARRILAALEAEAGVRYISPMRFAYIYAALGDKNRAFASLERAVEDRYGGMPMLGLDPDFDSLRSDPRYAVIARKVGLQ